MPNPASIQRLFLAFLPAVALAGIGLSTVWGESGLLVRHELGDRLSSGNQDLAAVERENQRLYRELERMEQDPVVIERQIAEELGWARQGTTVYRFDH
ncbi:MAG: septum formation initiator family protein [Myxococcota bacterium]